MHIGLIISALISLLIDHCQRALQYGGKEKRPADLYQLLFAENPV